MPFGLEPREQLRVASRRARIARRGPRGRRCRGPRPNRVPSQRRSASRASRNRRSLRSTSVSSIRKMKRPPRLPGPQVAEECGTRIAQVQGAGGRRREPGDGRARTYLKIVPIRVESRHETANTLRWIPSERPHSRRAQAAEKPAPADAAPAPKAPATLRPGGDQHGQLHHRAQRRARPDHRCAVLEVRRSGLLLRHRVSSRHPELHHPGRRL